MVYTGSIFKEDLENETFISLILRALMASGITSIEDIEIIEKKAKFGMANRLEHPWIQFIHWAFLKQEEEIKKLLNVDKIHFLDMQYYNSYSYYLPSLCCFFPNKITLALADTTIAQEVKIAETNEVIRLCSATGLDVLRRFLLHKELFFEELLTVSPQMVTTLHDSDMCEIFSWRDKNNICYIDQLGMFGNENSKGNYIKNLDANKLFIELPMLNDLTPDEYNELRYKYKTEFLRFETKMDELLYRCKNGEELETIIIKEYNEASLEIRKILIDKKEQLKIIGRDMVLGIILTVIPILIKDYVPFDSEILSSVIGGETIFPAFKDIFKYNKIERQNPYWLLWKWEELYKNK